MQNTTQNPQNVLKTSRFALTLLLLFILARAAAHPMPNTLVNLVVGHNALQVEVNVPLRDVETVLGANAAADSATLLAYFQQHLRLEYAPGITWPMQLLRVDTTVVNDPLLGLYAELHLFWRAWPPAGTDDLRHFILYYDAVLHQIVTHQALISVTQDWENGLTEQSRQLAVVQVDGATGTVFPVSVSLEAGSLSKGFRAMLWLGMQHILTGTDHLLFVLLLLLVAPLRTAGGRWSDSGGGRYAVWRLFKMVTAFTLGHSLTLALCALGWLPAANRWVEVAIALSILVSAWHAWRPLFFQREVLVAGGFGLVHGMAFSTTLTHLQLSFKQLLLSILGFNLGIELIQIGLVLLVAPLLVWGSQRAAIYQPARQLLAVAGAAAALFWLVERLTAYG